ncbi:nicotinamide-nucleotide amidohydrolase family protein [bacterium]|nr:nicotinamide-nucleotide amidohydrolase family protein [bacterium]
MSLVLGLDMGGASLKLGAWRGDERLVWREGIPLPQSSDSAQVTKYLVEAIDSLVESLEQQPEALGVGSCGVIRGGVILQSPNTPWEKLAVEELLGQALGYGVHLLNDADAFLLSVLPESGAERECVLGITLGSGLGTAVWHKGKLLSVGAGISPEGGHITIDAGGITGTAGIPGTLESMANIKAVLRYFAEAGGHGAASGIEVYEAAKAGDAAAQEAWERFGGHLGTGLGSLCNLFAPAVVLIGGGLAGAHSYFGDAAALALTRHRLASMPQPEVRYITGSPDAVARGAARYAANMLGHGAQPVVGPDSMPANPIQIVQELTRSGKTLGVAESCTGGALAAALTAVPGASKIFLGGVVSYADSVKEGLLDVSQATLKNLGAVSEEAAREMAEGALRLLRTDYAIAITGIAGPGGGTKEKPVGLVFIAWAGPGGTRVERCQFGGNRAAVQDESVSRALAGLLKELESSPSA